MRDTIDSLDLSTLEADYEVVGELSSRVGARTFMGVRKETDGKRRGDDSRVLITVFTAPEGDAGNALSHLAADTNLLAHTIHRRLVPVIEGRWIGKDAYAVITQRTTDPSLAEKIATGEPFHTTRVAAILREVNGLIDWAREQKVVHRHVNTSGVFLEPRTDRVRVSFSVSPLPLVARDDAADDACTIARLAMAMLTGRDETSEGEDRELLAQLRPDLPERLSEATAAILGRTTSTAPPDVATYLTLIGMSDPLAAGETEAARIRAEVLEEQRAEREKLANERAAFEEAMENQRVTFERKLADEHEKFAEEKAELQRIVADERAQLVAKRAELEKTVAEQRATLERTAAKDRKLIDELRAEIVAAGEREIEKKRQLALADLTDEEETKFDEGDLATPAFVAPVTEPLEKLEFDNDSALMRPAGSPKGGRSSRSKWLIPSVAVTAALLIVVLGLVLANQREPSPVSPASVAKAVPVTPAVAPQSAPEVVAPPDSAATAANDSTIDAALDSAAAARAKAIQRHEALLHRERVRRDSLAKLDTTVRPDTESQRPAVEQL